MISNYTIVDELGRVKAKIAELEQEEKRLADELREDGTTWKRDARAMRDKLWAEGFYAFVKAHEEEVPRAGAVRVVARTGQELGRAAA